MFTTLKLCNAMDDEMTHVALTAFGTTDITKPLLGFSILKKPYITSFKCLSARNDTQTAPQSYCHALVDATLVRGQEFAKSCESQLR